MTTKSSPAAVNISLVVLFFITGIGIMHVSYVLGHIWRLRIGPVPIELVGRTIIYCVVPLLAIVDLMNAKRLGRYLAILSMMSVWGLFLRWQSDVIVTTLYSDGINFMIPIAAAIFSVVMALPALILTLGFSKRVEAFLE